MFQITKTPTSLSKSTPDSNSQMQPGQGNLSNQNKLLPAAIIPPTATPSPVGGSDDIGFDINFGFVTITNIKLSNESGRNILALLILIAALSPLYKEYSKKKKHLIDKQAYEFACAAFLDKLEQIKEKKKTLKYPNNTNSSRKEKEEIKAFWQDMETVMAGIEKFQDKYRGQINSDLEESIRELSKDLATKQEIGEILTALEKIISIATRLGLSPTSVHPIRSLIFQLQKIGKK